MVVVGVGSLPNHMPQRNDVETTSVKLKGFNSQTIRTHPR